MLDRLRSACAPFVLPALFAAALLDLVGRRLFAVLRRPGAPDSLRELAAAREGLGPFAANLLLLAAGLALVLLVAVLGFPRRGGAAGATSKLAAITGLVLLALTTLRAALDDAAWVGLQQLALAAALLIAAGVCAFSDRPRDRRLVLAALLAVATLPLVWRVAFAWSDGRVRPGSALDALRGVADGAVLLAWAATALALVVERRALVLVPAALAGGAVLALAWTEPDVFRELVSACSGLWLTAWPPAVAAVLAAAGTAGVVAWVVAALTARRAAGGAAALLLLVMAGFLPIANAQIVASWCAAALAIRWCQAAIEAPAGLVAALREERPSAR